MRKTVSVLVLVGLLSSIFVGCGAKQVATIINNEKVSTASSKGNTIVDDEEFSSNLEKLIEEDDMKKNDTKVLKEPTRIEMLVSKSLVSDECIDISDYKLTPDEAINVFYRKDPEGLIKQKKVYKFLMDKYGDESIDTFNKHRDEVDENIKGVITYIAKPKKGREPFVFIGKAPIYAFEGWLGNKTTMYVNYRGDAESADSIKLAFDNGCLYRIRNGKNVQVIDRPNIKGNDSITWNE